MKINKKMLLATVISAALSNSLFAADWDDIPVPVTAGSGHNWAIQESYSDSFNYSGKTNVFRSKWNDHYFNGWSGPGLTYWSTSESSVSDGKLVIGASRRSGTSQVNAGVVTSKTTLKYPVFIEARIKVSNLELSSNLWLLSADDEREIDILEVYGGASDAWFAQNMSTNYHVFMRNADNSIKSDFNDQTHNTPSWGTYWRSDYHRFGAYWKSPTDVTFFIDGQETPKGSWDEVVMKDKDYSGAILDKSVHNMDREMFLIIDTEDHSWRSEAGIFASDEDLANSSKNKMYIDWIRTYKPVENNGGDSGTTTPPESAINLQFVHSEKCLDVKGGANWNGSTYQQFTCNTQNVNQLFTFSEVSSNEYLIEAKNSNLCLELEDGRIDNGAKIHQWICNSSNPNQLWTVFSKTSDTFELRNSVTGKCIDIRGVSMNNGAALHQWECLGTNNQRLKFLR
jgi:hypothetical protein